MKNAQYQFLKTLCDLFDGEHFVSESAIRAAWPDCPPHSTILTLGKDTYFEYDLNLSAPGYLPTAQGLTLVAQYGELRRMEDAADKRAERSEQEAEAAKNDAKKALRQARLSNIIAAIAALIALAAWLMPGDRVIEFIRALFRIG